MAGLMCVSLTTRTLRALSCPVGPRALQRRIRDVCVLGPPSRFLVGFSLLMTGVTPSPGSTLPRFVSRSTSYTREGLSIGT